MPEDSSLSRRRRIAAAVATLAAVWLCYGAGKHGLAGHYAASSNFEDWTRSTRVEPDNPEIWYQMGRFRQFDFDHSDLPLAVSYYLRAVQLNPRSPYYKLDLAGALEMSGDTAGADRNFRAAQSDYPISGEVAWKYGNFLLRQSRLPDAYAQIHRAVMVDSKLLPLAISRVWRSDPDVSVLLDQLLPGTPEAEWQALNFLTDAREADAALAVWNRLVAGKPSVQWGSVFALTDALVAHGQFEEARTVWRQAIAQDENSASAYADDSLVYDGGFERDVQGGGFGWRQRDVPGADFSFDSAEKHSGNRSARVTFDGSQNLSYQDLYQLVLVAPGTRYRFRGYLRTDQISTDSGVRFEIKDPKDEHQLDILTPNETGTQPWTLEELEFTAGPATHLIHVGLARKPSQRLDNKINGSVWIDDLSLTPLSARK